MSAGATSRERGAYAQGELPFRSLVALKERASTSRVLNLSVVHERSKNDPEYRAKPLFRTGLNNALIVKHTLRSNEQYIFGQGRTQATKIIVPYDYQNLAMGGRSVFFGEKNYQLALTELLGTEGYALKRDLETLALIDVLPSLDPFLLREQLRRHHMDVAACYFDISESDVNRMRNFIGTQIWGLVAHALGNTDETRAQLGKMVTAILSVDGRERLEPLRQALGMNTAEFREGAFSWRGFLYYKWVLHSLEPSLGPTLKHMAGINVISSSKDGTAPFVTNALQGFARELWSATIEVRDALNVYDRALKALLEKGNAAGFREFLLNAPGIFLDIGEKLGRVSHSCAFWQYRFKNGAVIDVSAEEAAELCREFGVGAVDDGFNAHKWTNWRAVPS